MSVTKWIVGVAGTAVVATALVYTARSAGDGRSEWPAIVERAAAVGITFADEPKPMPTVAVTDLEGREVALAEWRGKVVVVNFWATWCGPCEREVPDFVALQEKYRDHVQFAGFAVDNESTDVVRAFAAKYGVNYPIAQVDPAIEEQFGGIVGLPTSFIVDREGRIVQTHIGWVSPAIYEQEIRLLAGMEPLAEAQ